VFYEEGIDGYVGVLVHHARADLMNLNDGWTGTSLETMNPNINILLPRFEYVIRHLL